MFLFFFFSSRRRHTRLQGDWSSDVCSSDLCPAASLGGESSSGDARAGGLCVLTAKLSKRTGVGNTQDRNAKYHCAGGKLESSAETTFTPLTNPSIVRLSESTRNVIASPGVTS